MVSNIITFAIAVAIVLFVLKILGKSVKILISVLVNSIVGVIVLFVLQALNIGVTVNLLSALLVGFLGLPGLILVLILQLGLGIK